MTTQEATQYLTHVSWQGSRLGLDRIGRLLEKLGNPHEKLRYVHVAGTNGKGSVSVMLACILSEAGYKTGLYTSPYINRFNERIQMDGSPIDDTDLVRITEQVRQAAETMEDHPTEFELITAVAFLYFYEVVAIICTEKLREKGWDISEAALINGLEQARWPARFEVVRRNPVVIVDGGHNPQCVSSVVNNLNTYFPGRKVIVVTGVMADKDYDAMFSQIIPLARQVFTVTPDNPRALPAEQLAAYFRNHGVASAKSCESMEHGIKAALNILRKEEVICTFGSFYMAGAVRKMFGHN